MKKIILFVVMTALFSLTRAQNQKNDIGRIVLNVVVPENVEGLTGATRSNLQNKLAQIATKNGMGGSTFNPRFVLAANVVVISKDITPTAPPMHAYSLEVNLYIGDGIEGTKFASTSVILKGVGETETKAYSMALKGLKTEDPNYQSFIESGKKRIVEYYSSKCDFILKEADQLSARSQYDAAISKLVSVPEVCQECYNKAMDAVQPIYKAKIDKQCLIDLSLARNAWSAGQNMEAANNAGLFLSRIDPMSSCYAEAKTLSSEIAKRVLELDKREWDFKLKQQQDQVDIERATIEASRDIGVAYGENQPNSVIYNYDVWGWW